MAIDNFHAAGNLRTQDNGGPYNLTLLNVQEAEVKGMLQSTVWKLYNDACV